MRHERHLVPVTAVAHLPHRALLLAGEGTRLRCYGQTSQSDNGRLLHEVEAFDGQSIHGIVFQDDSDDTALIWGGPLIRSMALHWSRDQSLHVTPGPVQNVGDWILDVAFAPQQDRVAIVTAHNALWTASVVASSESNLDVELRCVVKGSNCILYAAHALWLDDCRCLVASGTAFGDIIVWSATMGQTGEQQAPSQTHYTFSAHEGSVFGVHLSSPLLLNAQRGQRLLASCSDDRSIILWDITDLSKQSPTLAEIQHETGFSSVPQADTHAPSCLAKTMGHLSRVWHVRFSARDEKYFSNVLSFGEDGSVITWALNPKGRVDSAYPFDLRQLHASTAHAGKNIWSVMQRNNLLTTGGADGAIARYGGGVCATETVEIEREPLQEADERDNFRAYGFVDSDQLVATTDQGRVVLVSLSDSGCSRPVELSKSLTGLRGYSIVATIPGVAFIAGTDGSVSVCEKSGLSYFYKAERCDKVSGLFTFTNDQADGFLLLVSVKSPIATLFSFRIDNVASGSRTCTISLPPGCVPTSFACLASRPRRYALVGTRNGSILAACLGDGESGTPADCQEVAHLVHGKDAVTSIQIVERQHTPFIFSTGRDGTVAVHQVSMAALQTDRPELTLRHRLQLPLGPNVEGFNACPSVGLIIWGFRSKSFVAYNLTDQREVMTVDCGGAHRNLAFRLHENEGGGTLIWTKASKVYQKSQSVPPYRLLNSGAHGREIKAMAISGEQIIATGSEDTDIKLFRSSGEGFKCMQTLRKHVTGIQHLQWSSGGRCLFSSGGFEEFYVWRVYPGVPLMEIGVVCESQHPMSCKSDLRVLGFDVASPVDEDTEAFHVSMAYSDSSLKLWEYQPSTKAWHFLSSGDYLTSCLTNAFRLNNGLLTTATDGHLVHWTPNPTEGQKLTWTTRRKLHQSAIHASATIEDLGDGSSLLATAGDDNAIALTRLVIASADSCLEARTLLIPGAHAAAITGLALIPLPNSVAERGGGYELVTTGLDQRVKIWPLRIDADRPGVEAVEVGKPTIDRFSSVADASGLEACVLEDGGRGVLVCGVGMECWRLTGDSKIGDGGEGHG